MRGVHKNMFYFLLIVVPCLVMPLLFENAQANLVWDTQTVDETGASAGIRRLPWTAATSPTSATVMPIMVI